MLGISLLTSFVAVIVTARTTADSMDSDSIMGTFLLIETFGIVWQSVPIVKRLHDLNRPGAHYWLVFVPLYNIFFALLLLVQEGTEGDNKYGPDRLKRKNVSSSSETDPQLKPSGQALHPPTQLSVNPEILALNQEKVSLRPLMRKRKGILIAATCISALIGGGVTFLVFSKATFFATLVGAGVGQLIARILLVTLKSQHQFSKTLKEHEIRYENASRTTAEQTTN